MQVPTNYNSVLDHKLKRLEQDDLQSFVYSFNHAASTLAPLTLIPWSRLPPSARYRNNRSQVINAVAERIGKVLRETPPQRLHSIVLRTTDEGPTNHNNSLSDILQYLSSSQSLKELTLSGKIIPRAHLYLGAMAQSPLQQLTILCRQSFPWRQVCHLVRTTTTLEHLELCGNRIKMNASYCWVDNSDLIELCDALAENASLKRLEFYLFEFGTTHSTSSTNDMHQTADNLHKQNHSIHHLVLQDNKLTYEASVLLMRVFGGLTSLQLNGNDASHEGLLQYYNNQQRPLQLESFSLSSMQFASTTHDGVISNPNPVPEMIANCHRLTELELCNREGPFDNDFMTHLGRALFGGHSLYELSQQRHLKSLIISSPVSNDNLHLLWEPLYHHHSPGAADDNNDNNDTRPLLTISNLSLTFQNQSTLPIALQHFLVLANVNIQRLTLDFGELTNEICSTLWTTLRRQRHKHAVESLVLKGVGQDLQSRAAFHSFTSNPTSLSISSTTSDNNNTDESNFGLCSLRELTLDEGLRESLMGLKFLIALPLHQQVTPTAIHNTTNYCSLVKLTLSRMVLGETTTRYLASFIRNPHCFLRHVCLYSCRIVPPLRGVEPLLQSLTQDDNNDNGHCRLGTFELHKEGGFSMEEAHMITATVLPNTSASLRQLTLNGFSRLDVLQVADLKQALQRAMSQNKCLHTLNLDLEDDSYIFPAKIRFYGLRNALNALLSNEDTATVPTGLWPLVLERLARHSKGDCKRAWCPSAVFHLLSSKIDILVDPLTKPVASTEV